VKQFAQRMVTEAGTVVDVHPSSAPAFLDVGGAHVGELDAAAAVVRHAAADAATAAVIDEGLFEVAAQAEFVYYTYADTVDELCHHIAANWRDSRIGDDTAERSRWVLEGAARHVRPRVVEHVRLTALRVRRWPGSRR